MDLICLDTDVLIEHKRAKEKNKTFFYLLADKGFHFAVTTITVYELLRGDNSNEDLFWKDFFNRVRVLEFDYSSALTASSIYKKLKDCGKLIPTEDILIGAIAINYKVTLATRNMNHFERIEGLKIYDTDL